MTVSQSVLEELKRIILDSEITKYESPTRAISCTWMKSSTTSLLILLNREDDKEWPEPDRVGRQELEIILGDEHISFTVRLATELLGVFLVPIALTM